MADLSQPVTFSVYYSKSGPLTKTIKRENDKLVKTPAAQMTRGFVERREETFDDFVLSLESCSDDVAFGYGCYRGEFSRMHLVSSAAKRKEPGNPRELARTKEFFEFPKGPGILMFDHDPSDYGKTCGFSGFMGVLENICPAFVGTARAVRGSVSSGVHLSEEPPKASNGFHIYIPVKDASDIPRFTKALLGLLWLHGYGFVALASNGACLIRTLFDGAVYSPERLDFVARPVISGYGLSYEPASTEYTPGEYLDTSQLPSLTLEQEQEVKNLQSTARVAVRQASEAKRNTWRAEKVSEMVSRGALLEDAERDIDLALSNDCRTLQGSFILHFDTLGSNTVSDVLLMPEQFDGKTLCDPIDGLSGGMNKAKLFWNNGKPTINSFKHGGVVYSLEGAKTTKAPALLTTSLSDDEFHNTHLGNAKRLLLHYGGVIWFVPGAGWLVWVGGAWVWDLEEARVTQIAGTIRYLIMQEINGTTDLDVAKRKLGWAGKSESLASIMAAVTLLKTYASIRCPFDQIDADPMKIGFDSGRQVIDLNTGESRTTTQADLITKTLNVNAVGDASRAVLWLRFLNEVFQGDVALIALLQRYLGYVLTGLTSEQKIVFLYGLGSNGKSVFVDLVQFIMGDYARIIPSETLTQTNRQAGSASPDLAALNGVRFALSSETEEGRRLAESCIKSLTGDAVITARRLYQDPVEFTPRFKIFMVGNHKPSVRGGDDGIWRRIVMIPFVRQFSPAERDPKLLDKLKAEAPHILAWMVQGCLEWQVNGLGVLPEVVRLANEDYRVEQDVTGMFLFDCCYLHEPESRTAKNVVYVRYQEWCVEYGLKPLPSNILSQKLSERGIQSGNSGGRYWKGLGLLA